MNPNAQARDGYGSSRPHPHRPRHRVCRLRPGHPPPLGGRRDRPGRLPRLAEAVIDNQRLWGTLAEDLMRDDATRCRSRCARS